MGATMRIFMLLLKKNFLVRKKHWVMSLVIQLAISVGLFLLTEGIRFAISDETQVIDYNSYYPPTTKTEILSEKFKTSTTIRYTPSNAVTDKIMRFTQKCLKLPSDQVDGSFDEETMLAEIAREQSTRGVYDVEPVGIIFEILMNNSMPGIFKYRLRTSNRLSIDLYDPRENGYKASDILDRPPDPLIPVQLCLDEAYIQFVTKNKPAFDLSIQQMPYPPYNEIGMSEIVGFKVFAEFAGWMLIIIAAVEITFPASEKNIGVNILMSVNGVKNQMNLLSWLVSGAIWSISYLVPIVIILKLFWPPYEEPFIQYGNPLIVWLVLTLQAIHHMCLGYHLSAYFWKPSHGVFVTLMVLFISKTVHSFVKSAGLRHLLFYAGIISPNLFLEKIFSEINAYETGLTGIGFFNMFRVVSSGSPVDASIGVMIILSILGSILHFYMAVYVHAVRPGKYGVRQHPLFCFQRSNKVEENHSQMAFEDLKITRKEFEPVPEGSLEPGIRIRGLKKTYTTDWIKQTKVNALRGVSVDFYKSQITALLGHNGAGKTTMMSILSGLTSSSEGVVYIDGSNIKLEPETIRKNIGLCPQENIVFPDLNVYQQLMFFGVLKAKDKSTRQLEEEVEILLSKVNLTDKKNSLPDQLSGGQKRRLCLAIAVIGDANVLILDEPTSGMDAESKREVWDIILKMRGHKTIIISTHDMEEADILGDRIAIMHTGKLKSYGTAMFLKKLYGDGQVEVTLSLESGYNAAKIVEEIGLTVNILTEDDGKVILAIPMTESLPEALDKLESSKKKLGITGMSVSIITLEQVFMKITREESDDVDSSNTEIQSSAKTEGFPYFVQTFSGYLIKKFAYARKNPWTFWFSLLLPCATAGMMWLAFGLKPDKDPIIDLTLSAYSSSQAFVQSSRPSLADLFNKTVAFYGGKATVVEPGISVTDSLLNYAKKDIGLYKNKMIVSAEFNGSQNILANGFFSGSAMRGIPATINCLSNTLLMSFASNEGLKIQLSFQALPEHESPQAHSGDGWGITLPLIMFLAPAVALYVNQPLSELSTGIKQLQDMTGASKISYWASMFIFDYVQYTISIFLLLASFILVDIFLGTQLYHGIEIILFLALLLLFGLSVLPFVYMMSFMKLSQNATINILSIMPLVLATVDLILFSLSFTLESQFYKVFRCIQSYLFMLIPQLGVIYGHVAFFDVVSTNARCRRMPDKILHAICDKLVPALFSDPCCAMNCSNGSCKNPQTYFTKPLLMPSLLTCMAFLVIGFFLYFGIIFILEQKFIAKFLAKRRGKHVSITTNRMDELVQREKAIVDDAVGNLVSRGIEENNENVFLVQGLKKNYGNLHVVKGINFRVKEGECFGLLGVNGAGKSTTFKMLTGVEIPHGGSMYLKNIGLHENRVKYLAEMGYCPQQDAIIETLNSWDHLYLFARLRGVPNTLVHSVVRKWIMKLNLIACAAQPSGTYSGGNKRRLQIAMALIGNPALVLMDEPTTGVDPAARRSLWNTLKTCQEFGQSIILTSHSMEECEVLCNRLVIMVKGQLVCVGAVQELKQRFGAGYNIHVKLSPNGKNDEIEQIKRRIESSFKCKKMDENSGFLGYHITDRDVTWTMMYGAMNALKNDFDCIEDFAVLSSTLEQLFIQFARAGDDQENGDATWWRHETPGSPV